MDKSKRRLLCLIFCFVTFLFTSCLEDEEKIVYNHSQKLLESITNDDCGNFKKMLQNNLTKKIDVDVEFENIKSFFGTKITAYNSSISFSCDENTDDNGKAYLEIRPVISDVITDKGTFKFIFFEYITNADKNYVGIYFIKIVDEKTGNELIIN